MTMKLLLLFCCLKLTMAALEAGKIDLIEIEI